MTDDQVRRRAHARLGGTLALLEATDLSPWKDSEPPPLLRRGIDEFNRGEFFEQHETLEELWRAEPEPVRYLYQGILQIGVGFYHLRRTNFHGAVVKLENGLALLARFEPEFMGVDVARLRRESRACLERVLQLGRGRLEEFDASHLPVIRLARDGGGQLPPASG